ncbi:MAG: biotin-dependent carboxyltransferase family protein [Rhizobacter sp.]|nr:biotin-dependent carboxyltransferase family protein [Rhizobacter sp.]
MSDAPQLEVVAPGAYASLQDLGRRGYRRVGVPWAGVLDSRLMRIANALVGNAEGAPVIECFDGGLQLAARGGALRLAVAGDAVLEFESAGERRTLAAWRSLTLADGDVLRVRRLERGRIAVIAVEGMTLPSVLGSASTYARAAIGGVDGRALAAGMRLPALAPSGRLDQMLPDAPRTTDGPIRVVAGPQADHFADTAMAALVEADYRVTTDADRMGVRLEGPALAHLGAPEIVSDATVPGSIQVPGNGQPIVLLADAQTAGGYPKIATVIGADLARLAASRPGQVVRFALVDAGEGERIARTAEAETRALLAALRPLLVRGVDEAALWSSNLVTGFVHALSSEYRPAVLDAGPRA